MSQIMFLYHVIASFVTGLAVYFLYQMREDRPATKIILVGILLLFSLALTALFFPVDGFARIQLLAWEAFLYFPIFLSLGMVFFWNFQRCTAIGLLILLAVTMLIAIDSFLIEPYWLKVTRYEISSPKLDEPLTVALLADIQTDSPGEYEREVLEIVKEENPDLILLAGDYIQVRDPGEYMIAVGLWRSSGGALFTCAPPP